MFWLLRKLPIFSAALLCFSLLAHGQDKKIQKTPVKASNPSSGAQMFKEYCAVCHGASGQGDGPAATALKVAPPNLTTLSERHGGKFPGDYVSSVLESGVKAPAHGSAEMPVWGPIFESMNHMDEAQVALRMTNLVKYLKSIQKK